VSSAVSAAAIAIAAAAQQLRQQSLLTIFCYLQQATDIPPHIQLIAVLLGSKGRGSIVMLHDQVQFVLNRDQRWFNFVQQVDNSCHCIRHYRTLTQKYDCAHNLFACYAGD
jgi:hypothetical protein